MIMHFHLWAHHIGEVLFDALPIVKQLGMPTYFTILPCVDLRWEELPYISKLNNLGLSDKELKKSKLSITLQFVK